MAYETPDRYEREPSRPGSDRVFGLFMSGVLWFIAAVRLWHASPGWWAFASAGALFAGVALLAPRRLSPLNWIWFRFGLLLHKIVSPIVLGLVFFGLITPIGLLMRWCGNRPLAPGFDRAAASYWAPRKDGVLRSGFMSKQY